MNTFTFYQPAPRWPTFAALAAALTIETVAVGLGSLRQSQHIPTVIGFSAEKSVEARFSVVPDDALPPPESSPPELPPPSDLAPDFVVVEPVSPPQPTRARRARPAMPSVAKANTFTATLAAARARLTNAPPPAYPYEARRAHQTGSGLFLLRFNGAGEVTEASISRSISSADLDQNSLKTFRHWRCEPGTYQAILVPVTFTLAGAQL